MAIEKRPTAGNIRPESAPGRNKLEISNLRWKKDEKDARAEDRARAQQIREAIASGKPVSARKTVTISEGTHETKTMDETQRQISAIMKEYVPLREKIKELEGKKFALFKKSRLSRLRKQESYLNNQVYRLVRDREEKFDARALYREKLRAREEIARRTRTYEDIVGTKAAETQLGKLKEEREERMAEYRPEPTMAQVKQSLEGEDKGPEAGPATKVLGREEIIDRYERMPETTGIAEDMGEEQGAEGMSEEERTAREVMAGPELSDKELEYEMAKTRRDIEESEAPTVSMEAYRKKEPRPKKGFSDLLKNPGRYVDRETTYTLKSPHNEEFGVMYLLGKLGAGELVFTKNADIVPKIEKSDPAADNLVFFPDVMDVKRRAGDDYLIAGRKWDLIEEEEIELDADEEREVA